MLSPSILSADFSNMEKAFELLNRTNVDYVHLDIMDGHYVPNISYGPDIVKNLRKLTNTPFDCHLMVENPENYIDRFASAGAQIITIHPNSTIHLDRVVNQIRSKKIKVGIAINPHEPLNVLEYILDSIDLVLIMSVNPGFGGQSFIDYSLKKIENLKKIIGKRDIIIEVDGGINTENVDSIYRAGADMVVAGSAVFNAANPELAIKNFKESYERHISSGRE